METFWGLSVTAWTAIYTILTALLVITAWVAAAIAWGQWRASREAVKEARRAQLEASRPYVIVTVEPTAVARNMFDLSVKNIGKRPAMDVRVHLDPAPVSADSTPGFGIDEVKMLKEPIRMIAPGQDMRAYWDDHHVRSSRDDLLSVYQVALFYSDSSGVVYREDSALDLKAMDGAIYVNSKNIHDIGVALAKIATKLEHAPILSRNARAEVMAVIEALEASEFRKARRTYKELCSLLQSAKECVHSDPKQIAELEAKKARLLEIFPSLKRDESPAVVNADLGLRGSRSRRGRFLETAERAKRLLLKGLFRKN